MLDRSLPPALASLRPKPLPPYRKALLGNGIPVHLIRFGTQPVASVQLVFRAGHAYEPKPGLDGLMCRMLTEGTWNYNALELAQRLDAEGAYFNAQPGYEVTSLSVSALASRMRKVVPLLQELTIHATFPEAEWQGMKDRTLQQLAVEEKKTVFHARRAFGRLMYGEGHPYGYAGGREELLAVTADDMRQYYHSTFVPTNCEILVSGQYDEQEMLDLLERQFGILTPRPWAGESRAVAHKPSTSFGTQHIEVPGGAQSSIRVGFPLIGRTHPDYHRLRMVVTLFGGFFGSRLMKNIREDKGYTYGIGSSLVALRHGGHLVIATDVGNAYVEPTLEEIRKEMQRLQQEPVGADELNTARNYLLGHLLSEQETPFQISDIVRNQLANGLPSADHLSGFEQVRAMTPADIQALAQQYLQPDTWVQVVSGARA